MDIEFSCSVTDLFCLPYTNPVTINGIHSLNFLENISAFCKVTDIPCFEVLVESALGFKAMVDTFLEYFLKGMQWIPHIDLWCVIC